MTTNDDVGSDPPMSSVFHSPRTVVSLPSIVVTSVSESRRGMPPSSSSSSPPPPLAPADLIALTTPCTASCTPDDASWSSPECLSPLAPPDGTASVSIKVVTVEPPSVASDSKPVRVCVAPSSSVVVTVSSVYLASSGESVPDEAAEEALAPEAEADPEADLHRLE